MATAAEVISRSMRLLGQLESGGTPTTEEYADGLTALNGVLADANNELGMCYALQEETLTLASADGSFTLGPSGDLVTTRPVEIIGAWIVESNVSHSVRLIDEAEYQSINSKTQAGDWPDRALYRPGIPNGTLLLYPVQNATRTLKVLTRTPFTAFATTGDTVTLPPGWITYLAHELACVWAPEFELPSAPPAVVSRAGKLKANIRRANEASRPLVMRTELALVVGSRPSGCILSDD